MKYTLILCVLSLCFVQCQKTTQETKLVERGVSHGLAQLRSDQVKDVSYELKFEVTDDLDVPLSGVVKIGFKVNDISEDVVIDFEGKSLTNLLLNEEQVELNFSNGHLIVPSDKLKKGYNELAVNFVSGEKGLNRSKTYLYTLFVPNRASNVFPCFDQPDIKAKYQLTLSVPQHWEVISATAISNQVDDGKYSIINFEQTAKISSYIMSFSAGEFERELYTNNELEIELLHRETDVDLVEANVQQIFKEHELAIKWLEYYTGIKLPFSKLGMVLTPGFPFGGMEHVGAIQYRARNLMLSADATLSEKMNRSKLIAHETAHMWFGNLVTMDWFDDVWVKEVFANFIADKMVKDLYPTINHDLEFLYEHYPAAYAIDRSAGTHAIHQQLDNLNDAAHMYGSIIYHKAPIMMYHLEQYIGESVFQAGIKEYLENYSYGNATWDDLVMIFEKISGKEMTKFSDAWVNQSGMPFMEINFIENESVSEYDISQFDLSGQGRVWPQYMSVTLSDVNGDHVTHEVFMDRHHYSIEKYRGSDMHKFILINSNGKGYGVFAHGLDYIRDEFIFNQARVDLSNYKSDIMRGAAYVNLHEYILKEGFHPQLYIMFLGNYLKTEQNELIIGYLLSKMQETFYYFLDPKLREDNASIVEQLLLDKIETSTSPSIKAMLFDAYVELAMTEEGLENLKSFWKGLKVPNGVVLSNYQKEQLAVNIAFKANNSEVLNKQISQMNNEDRKERLRFIMPALSQDDEVLNQFVETIRDKKNRSKEPWVLTSMYYLHHPYRNESSIQRVPIALDMIEELNQTGDIFFVKAWLDNVLRGYQSNEVLTMIETYKEDNPNLNPYVKRKLLQSSDLLVRSNKNLAYYYNQ